MATSAQRKLDRGVEHVKTLTREAVAFEHLNAYEFRTEKELRSAHEIHCRCYAIERKAPDPLWPLLAGEAVQNLRSALDHAIFPLAKNPERSQFPIYTDHCECQVGTKQLRKRIAAPIWTGIEAAQPYSQMPDAPEMHPLALLREYSNIDKHRILTTVAAAVDLESVLSNVPKVAITWHKTATGRPLTEHETEIAVYTVRSETELREVDVTPAFTYKVFMEGRPLDVLPWVARKVFEMVMLCETGLLPGIFAAYPI